MPTLGTLELSLLLKEHRNYPAYSRNTGTIPPTQGTQELSKLLQEHRNYSAYSRNTVTI